MTDHYTDLLWDIWAAGTCTRARPVPSDRLAALTAQLALWEADYWGRVRRELWAS